VLSRNSSAIPCLRPALLGKKMPALCSKIGYETASSKSESDFFSFLDDVFWQRSFLCRFSARRRGVGSIPGLFDIWHRWSFDIIFAAPMYFIWMMITCAGVALSMTPMLSVISSATLEACAW
jgi:hypothetical protein